MTDPSSQSGDNVPVKKPDDTGMALIVYILYLVAFVIGISAIVGVVLAYVQQGKGGPWLQSHYQFQIRTFWIGLLGSIISALLVFIVIGWFLMIAVAIWYIVRCVKGIVWLQAGEAVPDPTSWVFGTAKTA
jgi:uncharacterized membrane protein